MNMLDHLNNRDFYLEKYVGASACDVEGVLWIPLWNLSGQLVGYQTYRPNASKNDRSLNPSEMKYFTYLAKTNNKSKLSVFGLDLLSRTNNYSNVCFLVEGVFDAAPFHNLSLNCLGLLGVGSKPNKELLNFLKSLGYHLVAVCEDDKAGKHLAKYADQALYLKDGQDPGDLLTTGVRNLLKSNNFKVD